LAAIQPVLDAADVLLVSRTEATVLTGQVSPEGSLRSLRETGVPVVVETLGVQGVLVGVEDGQAHVPAFAVTGVRDTTGAGDAFAAGVVAGFLDGLGWEASARLGSAAAALKIQQVGARSGLPTRQEVESFLSRFQGGRDW
jgi:sugar/nucleoside kinase (ribokinase family)